MIANYAEIVGAGFKLHIQAAKKVSYFPHSLNNHQSGWYTNASTEFQLLGATPERPIQVPEDNELNFVFTGSVQGLIINSKSSSKFVRTVDQPGVTVFSTNFHRNVGIHEIVVRVNGHYLVLMIDVCPRKISYDSDLFVLREDLEQISRGLSVHLPIAGKLVGNWTNRTSPTSLEWVTHLNEMLDDFKTMFNKVSSNPNRTLKRVGTLQRVEKIKANHLDIGSRLLATRALAGLNPQSNLVPISVPRVDHHSQANLWLKAEIRRVYNQILDHISNRGDHTSHSYSLLLERGERQFRQFLQASFIRDLPDRVPGISIPLNVKSIPGYSDLFSILDSLSYGFSVNHGVSMLTIKPLDELYEAWCFIKVVAIIQKITGGNLDLSGLISAKPNSPDVRLIRGEFSASITQAGKNETISIAYNREFRGITGAQRPDIVIQILREGLNPVIVILDAKYRIDQSERYLRSFGMPGPPIDAVNSLHRYRDAIVLKQAKDAQVRPVVKGAILFPPAPETNTEIWKISRLFKSMEELGIGALPLLPGQDNLLEKWLIELLNSSNLELAWPGPNFEPYHSIILGASDE